MSENELRDINEELLIRQILDDLGKEVDPEAPEYTPMTPEEGIAHVAATYPPEDPVAKQIQDNLIDDLAESRGIHLENDEDRLEFIKELDRQIQEEGLESLDPELFDLLEKANGGVTKEVWGRQDDGSWKMTEAYHNGVAVDLSSYEEDELTRPAEAFEHRSPMGMLNDFFDGQKPQEVGQSGEGALPDEFKPDQPAVAPALDGPEVGSDPMAPGMP